MKRLNFQYKFVVNFLRTQCIMLQYIRATASDLFKSCFRNYQRTLSLTHDKHGMHSGHTKAQREIELRCCFSLK